MELECFKILLITLTKITFCRIKIPEFWTRSGSYLNMLIIYQFLRKDHLGKMVSSEKFLATIIIGASDCFAVKESR